MTNIGVIGLRMIELCWLRPGLSRSRPYSLFGFAFEALHRLLAVQFLAARGMPARQLLKG